MVSNVSPAASGYSAPLPSSPKTQQQDPVNPLQRQDTVSFGQTKVTGSQAQNMVYERAMEKLRAVVDEARAELGVPEGAVLDTSPDATAQRILDFALNFFDKYAEKHGLNDDEAGWKQFADFIGGAIGQGIYEARGILGALNALNPDISANID
ncbi:MAG: DUF5610 domain-containing protein, partial [Candidatus Hydrogenedentes bacterium]|nr:DUF5610 domain-containing protein [Candidatus Hydrogenedentota bacterium]